MPISLGPEAAIRQGERWPGGGKTAMTKGADLTNMVLSDNVAMKQRAGMGPMSQKIARGEIVLAGQPWSSVIREGQRLRIVDLEGDQGVDFLCYAAANPEERYHAANTLKKSKTLLLTKGHTLYSDVARPLMTIVEDTCGIHDTIGGCCSAPSN